MKLLYPSIVDILEEYHKYYENERKQNKTNVLDDEDDDIEHMLNEKTDYELFYVLKDLYTDMSIQYRILFHIKKLDNLSEIYNIMYMFYEEFLVNHNDDYNRIRKFIKTALFEHPYCKEVCNVFRMMHIINSNIIKNNVINLIGINENTQFDSFAYDLFKKCLKSHHDKVLFLRNGNLFERYNISIVERNTFLFDLFCNQLNIMNEQTFSEFLEFEKTQLNKIDNKKIFIKKILYLFFNRDIKHFEDKNYKTLNNDELTNDFILEQIEMYKMYKNPLVKSCNF